ncbi:MAG: dephospho-CoA kinase [Deltaproteobacteria bacterium]|nr:dephospho-CoA kinase [Deltaproteobacteria bacterium]
MSDLRVIGLTGNIACGKSLVERILRDAGVPVIDTDQVAREVVLPGSAGLEEIRRTFGSAVIAADGSLDRGALGAIVFTDPGARKDLEAITHPKIFARTAEQVMAYAADGHTLVVVSAALMVETGSYRNYAGLLVVTCPDEQQLARLLARDGLNETEAYKRIASQLPQADKASLADTVIDNGGTIAETEAQVLGWLKQERSGA